MQCRIYLADVFLRTIQIYDSYPEVSFPEVCVELHIRRKYLFFVTYIIFPCMLLSGVLLMVFLLQLRARTTAPAVLVVFLLPADSGEKVSLGVSILVAISVFLLLVAGNVPNTSDSVPLLGQPYAYCVTFAESEPYCHSILFVCLSGCLSVIPRPTAYHD